ncbi:RHS repeat domain-containing protein [Desulfovibrio sp. UCD-KL4C]|uniref:RHS repeat domain-containing protein n=1 Tax=Desulfovibrio sp. UCD-KL4C TaxID=2578120 RepID=UPI0025BF7503|nr:RHS repeat-associated core domain-containing protein [Desulfovibrio sp. UCD-KL4C]
MINAPLLHSAGLHFIQLIHFGHREYYPTIGRFITPDPIGFAGGDVDVYGYCLDDPINFHDRTGLEGKSEAKKSPKNNAKRKEETNKYIKKINKMNAGSNGNKTKI